MDVVLVSPFPPRMSGIASFAEAVRDALLPHVDGVHIVASLAGGSMPPEGVLYAFQQDSRAEHVRAAEAVNDSTADVVLIQHGCGIYGGEDGEYVLDLARALSVPYCVTLHTVLAHPEVGWAKVTRDLCAGAQTVFVFSSRARRLLADASLVPPGKVEVVPRGAPRGLIDHPGDGDLDRRLSSLLGLDVYGRRVVSTFGLLAREKGLEHAIRAIPMVIDVAPDVLYVVAGATHPAVTELHGETYRRELESLVQELGAQDHVVFVNRYLQQHELFTLLRRSQVFVTPYTTREKVVSGTLTFAIAAGCAVVSTPFYHAQDLARTGAVLLAEFDDDASLARGFQRLLGNPSAMASARRAASHIAQGLSWDAVGLQLAALLEDVRDRGLVGV